MALLVDCQVMRAGRKLLGPDGPPFDPGPMLGALPHSTESLGTTGSSRVSVDRGREGRKR